VVVCADHGELLGEHDLYGHEFALYDELINVPLIVDHPTLEADRRTDLVELLDLYHTLLDATAVKPKTVASDAVPLAEHRSLLSEQYREFASTDPTDPGRRTLARLEQDTDYAFIEYAKPLIELHHLEQKAADAGITLPSDHRAYATMRAARSETAKYIRADKIPNEGYRLDEDPAEESPVDPADDPVVADAEQALSVFCEEVGSDVADLSGDSSADPLSDADEEVRDRLRDLGYME
jgi:arylsulfatase A-like enzyme